MLGHAGPCSLSLVLAHSTSHKADGCNMVNRSLRLLTLGLSDQAQWIRLVIHPIEDFWTAMLVRAQEPPPEPGSLTGLCLFGKTSKEARGEALNYLGNTGVCGQAQHVVRREIEALRFEKSY